MLLQLQLRHSPTGAFNPNSAVQRAVVQRLSNCKGATASITTSSRNLSILEHHSLRMSVNRPEEYFRRLDAERSTSTATAVRDLLHQWMPPPATPYRCINKDCLWLDSSNSHVHAVLASKLKISRLVLTDPTTAPNTLSYLIIAASTRHILIDVELVAIGEVCRIVYGWGKNTATLDLGTDFAGLTKWVQDRRWEQLGHTVQPVAQRQPTPPRGGQPPPQPPSAGPSTTDNKELLRDDTWSALLEVSEVSEDVSLRLLE